MYTIRCEKDGFHPLALQTEISSMGLAALGRQVLFPLAAGELSEKDHARATALFADVTDASESGEDEETLKKLFELYEMMPTSTEIVFNIAITYESMGDGEHAVKYYTQAAEENPDRSGTPSPCRRSSAGVIIKFLSE